jgi:hypothetical protein
VFVGALLRGIDRLLSDHVLKAWHKRGCRFAIRFRQPPHQILQARWKLAADFASQYFAKTLADLKADLTRMFGIDMDV